VDYRIRHLVTLVKQDIGLECDIPTLANVVGVSPSTLRSLFVKQFGVPPHRFIRRMRLERARYLLCTKLITVKEAMYAVGLSDESHFVREFERAYGLSPRRYRQKYFGTVDPSASGV